MQKIKFRGKCVNTGEVITGDLHRWNNLPFIGSWQVYPDSVAQLCYVDENDVEYYEGDVVYRNGVPYVVALQVAFNK